MTITHDADVKDVAGEVVPATSARMATAAYTVSCGAVMWFNAKFGIGFIRPDDGGPNLFVHTRNLADDCRRLVRGQRVSYVVGGTERRAEADCVHPL
jgi:CspA family cold shock protein